MRFPITHQGVVSWLAPGAIALAISLALGGSVQAGEIRAKAEKLRSIYLVKYQSDNAIRFNNTPIKNIRKITFSQYLSDNPYVCTPSGFGQKARCYVRASSGGQAYNF